MAAQMREMFPDKEAVRKKLRDIQDKVSLFPTISAELIFILYGF